MVRAERVIAVLLMGAACAPSSPTAPLEPLVLFNTAYRFVCDRWSPGPPPDDRSYFDVRLATNGFDAHVATLQAAGIKVFYRFAAGSQVRVDTRASRLIALASQNVPIRSIDSVRDASTYLIRVVVGLHSSPTDADVALVTSLGGQVVFLPTGPTSRFLSAILDDRQIETLRLAPSVRHVEIDQYVCAL